MRRARSGALATQCRTAVALGALEAAEVAVKDATPTAADGDPEAAGQPAVLDDPDEEPVDPVQAYRDRASYTPERYLIVRPLSEEGGRSTRRWSSGSARCCGSGRRRWPSRSPPADDQAGRRSRAGRPAASRLSAQQIAERDLRIGQRLQVDRPAVQARPDQRGDRLGDVPDVGVHPGQHPAVADPERDEFRAALRVRVDGRDRRGRPPGRTRQGSTQPVYSMPRSYWSEKKYGTGA